MLSRLVLQLDDNKGISTYSASIFHGLLMDIVSKDYAEYIHRIGRNPFSQYIERNEDGLFWVISTLDDDSYDNIIKNMLDLETIFLKNKKLELNILDVSLDRFSSDKFISENLFNNGFNKFDINFISPTAFKSNGKYIIYPNRRLIFQSLMNKFDSVNDGEIYDEYSLEKIINGSEIDRYTLSSKYFSVKGNNIDSFSGHIRLNVFDKDMVGLVNLLLKFGEFSGVGIKSSMGMGAIKLGRGMGWKEKKN